VLAQVSDDELLERLLGRRIEGRSLVSLLELELDGLREAGLSEVEASAVSVVAEIARRHQPRDLEEGPIRDPAQVVTLLSELRHSGSTQLILILLDHRHRLLATIRAAQSTKGCPQASAEVLSEHAQRAHAVLAIMVHNHLDGTAEPTEADVRFTTQVRRGLEMVGVDLVDHVVITRRDWFSFRRAGLLN
jgi:DNA repair protein RadC